jgi:hypothetical protein
MQVESVAELVRAVERANLVAEASAPSKTKVP